MSELESVLTKRYDCANNERVVEFRINFYVKYGS